MGTKLAAEAKPLQQQRIIEKRYRTTVRAMRHITFLQFENSRFTPTSAVQSKLG
jgi:hypothetical protein